MCLRADGNVAFEDTSYNFGVCRPACHDSSLYIFVLVTFCEAVVLFVYVSLFKCLPLITILASTLDFHQKVPACSIVSFGLCSRWHRSS